MMRAHRAMVALVALVATSCGAGQTRIGSVFSTNWENDGGASIARLEQKLRRVPIPEGSSIAVGVVDDGLVGVSLAGGAPWKLVHAVSGRPDVAGRVVVATGGGEVFAVDATSGKLLWKRPTGGLELIGAGDDGDVTVVTLEGAGGVGSSVLAVTRDGTVLRQLETDKRLGKPAVVASVAFIPWQTQYISAYDVSTGDESARVVVRLATSHALTTAKTLYFGEIGLTRFDESIGGASDDRAASARLPEKEIFGPARWLPAAGALRGTTAGAGDKVRTYARPTPRGEPMAIADGTFYATYYRVVLGMDTSADARIRWVHAHGVDVLGGAAYRGGLAVCDANGKVTLLEGTTGLVTGELALGAPVKTCVVQADGLASPPSGKGPPPLNDQLAGAVALGDASLVAVQRLLLAELGKSEDASVTKLLVDLAAEPRVSPTLLTDVRARLAARRTGAEHLIAALERPYDFVHDVLRPPPVGPIADALAAMGEKRGAPALSRALNDPQTPPDDVKRAALALGTLAGGGESASLESFFALYRCTAENDDVVAAVVAVAQALVKVEGDKGKLVVARAARDPMTLPNVREKLTPLAEGVTVPADPSVELPDEKKPKGGKKKG